MDYVVFGVGFGATLLVLGLLFRDVGPRLRFRNPAGDDGVFHAEELVARISWRRFCSALGMVWAISGLAFVIATGICMLLVVSDDTAGWVMGTSLVALTLLMAFWTWAYFDRFGSYGILPERERVSQSIVATRQPVSARGAGVGASSFSTRSDADGGGVVVSDGDDTGAIAPQARTPDQEQAEGAGTPDQEPGAPPDDSDHPDSSAPERNPLLTPEERMAAASESMNHESLEADLDVPASTNDKPWRRSYRPSPASTAPVSDPDNEQAQPEPSPTEQQVRAESDDDEQPEDEPQSTGSSDTPPREQ